jgi:hypothetical protein
MNHGVNYQSFDFFHRGSYKLKSMRDNGGTTRAEMIEIVIMLALLKLRC